MLKQVISTLRVNVKSLAAESSIIRKEFYRHKDENIRNSLYLHRVKDVRKESRHAQLALAAVKGIPYENVERNASKEPDWKKIIAKVDRHTQDYDIKLAVGNWCMSAKEFWIAKQSNV